MCKMSRRSILRKGMIMQQTVLILGANGRFGRNAAEAFWNAGWAVRLFDRARDDLEHAARGADVIVAAWNPLYPDWADQLPGLHSRIQAAAKASGATVIVPGNVYIFGAQTPLPWGPQSTHAASNPLGRLRIEMEQSYRRSGVRTIVLRAGDFIDTEASGNWLDKMILPKLGKGRLSYPGDLDAVHAWAYLPDLARAAVALAERRNDLAPFEDVGFAGYTLTARQMAGILSDIAGLDVSAQKMSWWPLHLTRPFWPMARCLIEMRYLWDLPHLLDGTRLNELCPGLPQTPVEEALRAAAAPWLPGGNAAKVQSITRSTQTSR